MKNTILNDLVDKGILCPSVIEVESLNELQTSVETLTEEFLRDYSPSEIRIFFDNLTVYYLGEDSEEEEKIYNFNAQEYLNDLLPSNLYTAREEQHEAVKEYLNKYYPHVLEEYDYDNQIELTEAGVVWIDNIEIKTGIELNY